MQKKTIIVTGGAGYIGSSTSWLLEKKGYIPVILDNFSTSKRPQSPSFQTIEIDVTQLGDLHLVFEKLPKIHAIFHFAAKALVPESTEKSWNYFYNNINATLNLAECAIKYSVPYFIHSSTCAVYGHPKEVPIKEESELAPETPYGESKLASEKILKQYSQWKNLSVLNLRYFNPAGAFPGSNCGELHDPETHLIPNLVTSLIRKVPFRAFGDDYPTPDGTCIRDFIHIRDLAQAHLLALEHLEKQPTGTFDCINIGRNRGVSVKEAVLTAEKVLGLKSKVEIHPRRHGDPATLIADTTKMRQKWNWEPEFSLEEMIEDHWNFIQGRLS